MCRPSQPRRRGRSELSLSFTLALTTLVASTVAAQPDAARSSVEPWDDLGFARVSPGTQSGIDLTTVRVRDAAGNPVVDSAVEIVFDACFTLCVDDPDDGLTGVTNGSGNVVLDPRVGGCSTCTIRVLADGVVLREFDQVISPDWDGTCADGVVDDHDLESFGLFGGVCFDWNGDGEATLADFADINLAYGDANDNPCPVDANVSPWDSDGVAYFVPGQTGDDLVTVNVPGRGAGTPVEIRIAGCDALCADASTLSGETDASGSITLDPAVGGCDDCTVQVLVCGVVATEYTTIASPDLCPDGRVDECDYAVFQQYFLGTDPCADFNRDGVVDLNDHNMLLALIGSSNDTICPPSASLSTAALWDGYGHALVSPGTGSVDQLQVTAKSASGAPLPFAKISLRFEGCEALCGSTDDISTLADENGVAVLDPELGGCDVCDVYVDVCGHEIRHFTSVVSPDWNGLAADGVVGADDEAWFLAQIGLSDACADYDGDGDVDGDDQSILAAALGDTNDELCTPLAIGEPAVQPIALGLSITPTPATSRVTLEFTLTSSGEVAIDAFDVNGRRVLDEIRGGFAAGRNRIALDARIADFGVGMYFVRLRTAHSTSFSRLIISR